MPDMPTLTGVPCGMCGYSDFWSWSAPEHGLHPPSWRCDNCGAGLDLTPNKCHGCKGAGTLTYLMHSDHVDPAAVVSWEESAPCEDCNGSGDADNPRRP